MHLPLYSKFTNEYVLYITQQNRTEHNTMLVVFMFVQVSARDVEFVTQVVSRRDVKYNNCPLNLFGLEFANAFYSDVSGDGTDFQYVADNRRQLLVAKHVKAGAQSIGILSLAIRCSLCLRVVHLFCVHCSYDNKYVET